MRREKSRSPRRLDIEVLDLTGRSMAQRQVLSNLPAGNLAAVFGFEADTKLMLGRRDIATRDDTLQDILGRDKTSVVLTAIFTEIKAGATWAEAMATGGGAIPIANITQADTEEFLLALLDFTGRYFGSFAESPRGKQAFWERLNRGTLNERLAYLKKCWQGSDDASIPDETVDQETALDFENGSDSDVEIVSNKKRVPKRVPGIAVPKKLFNAGKSNKQWCMPPTWLENGFGIWAHVRCGRFIRKCAREALKYIRDQGQEVYLGGPPHLIFKPPLPRHGSLKCHIDGPGAKSLLDYFIRAAEERTLPRKNEDWVDIWGMQYLLHVYGAHSGATTTLLPMYPSRLLIILSCTLGTYMEMTEKQRQDWEKAEGPKSFPFYSCDAVNPTLKKEVSLAVELIEKGIYRSTQLPRRHEYDGEMLTAYFTWMRELRKTRESLHVLLCSEYTRRSDPLPVVAKLAAREAGAQLICWPRGYIHAAAQITHDLRLTVHLDIRRNDVDRERLLESIRFMELATRVSENPDNEVLKEQIAKDFKSFAGGGTHARTGRMFADTAAHLPDSLRCAAEDANLIKQLGGNAPSVRETLVADAAPREGL